jgi:hypothetical protein
MDFGGAPRKTTSHTAVGKTTAARNRNFVPGETGRPTRAATDATTAMSASHARTAVS